MASISFAEEQENSFFGDHDTPRYEGNGADHNGHHHGYCNGTSGPKKSNELVLIPKRSRTAVSRRDDDTDEWGTEELDVKEEHVLALRDVNLKDTLLSRLNTFRRNRELCDVVLFVQEREILAHKVVLASISPSLFDMFVNADETSTPTHEKDKKQSSPPPAQPPTPTIISAGASTKQLSYYEFTQVDYECFDAIVNFAYTSYLEIRSRKVAELYKTAFSLQITPITKACARYLAEHLSFANCIGIRKQANFNNDAFLVGKVDHFISDNFEAIVNDSVEFTQLSCIKVRIIVTAEESKKPDAGYMLADKALQYFQKFQKSSERVDQQIESLAEKSHLLYIEENQSLQDCSEMDDHSSVGSCDIVQDYKRTGMKPATNLNAIPTQTIQHHITGATAVRINASRVANGKYASNESLNSMASSATDVEEEIQSRLIAVHLTSPGFWVALVVLFRRLVVLSIQVTENDDIKSYKTEKVHHLKDVTNGYKKSLSNTTFETHQPASEVTKHQNERAALLARLVSNTRSSRIPLPSMEMARCSIGASFVNGKIIICGGYDRGECLKSAEEYDIAKGEWRTLPDMCKERGRFDSAVINGKVYAIAGSSGNNDLKSAECYDPKAGTWMPIKSLSRPRSHNSCATLDTFIYCIGGSSDQVVLRECERYDPENNEWKPIAPMHTARYQAGCTAWRGMVVSVAGCDRWNCLDTVEAYDPKTDSWRFLAKLKTPRRGCAVAVVRDSLYVIGGHDGTQSLNSVEILDHPNGQWRLGPSLNTPRANTHAVVTAGNVIYVIGGFDGVQFLSSIELLESEAAGWRNWQQTRSKDGSISDGTIPEDEEEETKSTAATDRASSEPVANGVN